MRQDVDPLAVAAFIIASIEGCAGLAKATRSLCYLGVDLTADGTPIYSANAVFKLFGEAKGIAAEAAI